MTDTPLLVVGGPLNGLQVPGADRSLIDAALVHGYRYRLVNDEGTWVWQFVGLRASLPTARPFVALRAPSRWQWRVVAKR